MEYSLQRWRDVTMGYWIDFFIFKEPKIYLLALEKHDKSPQLQIGLKEKKEFA